MNLGAWGSSEFAVMAAVAGMAVATYLTRIAGVAIMSRVRITPRVETFLRYVASSVLVALILPAIVQGGGRHVLALVVVLGVYAGTRNTMLAVGSAVGAAALAHAAGV